MPNDAKFGLVLGLGLVILIAALYFRREDDFPQSVTKPNSVSVGVPFHSASPVPLPANSKRNSRAFQKSSNGGFQDPSDSDSESLFNLAISVEESNWKKVGSENYK